MTVEQALARARELRPGCKISDETCRRWLCEEDALLRQQLFEKSGADEYAAAGADLAWSGEALPDDTVLLVPVPFDALYPHVLCARIDAALGETDRYAGEQARCSGLLSELAVWLRQKHPHSSSRSILRSMATEPDKSSSVPSSSVQAAE